MSEEVDTQREIDALRAAHAAKIEALRRAHHQERVQWQRALDALNRRIAEERLRMAAELDRLKHGERLPGIRRALRRVVQSHRMSAVGRRLDELATTPDGQGHAFWASPYLRARDYMRRLLS